MAPLFNLFDNDIYMPRTSSLNLIETLQKLEPTFIEAGKLAYKMQEGVRSYNKRETGSPAGDIVTEADLAVQELLLQAMSKTELINCRLLAEEDTPAAKLFNEYGEYYLGIDPIDDTAIYAKGGQHFSTIVTLHDGRNILYVFLYFPAWDWMHTIVKNVYEVSGLTPDISLTPGADKTIVYGSGNPEKRIPAEILKDLEARGINFSPIASITGEYATIGSFITGKVAGVYHEDMNAYDGIVEFAIASARGQKIYSGGPNGPIDLTDIRKRVSGLYYPGYYVALNE